MVLRPKSLVFELTDSINYLPALPNKKDEVLFINGGTPLKGTINISGAKNAALPLIFASILGNTPSIIENVPNLSDIHVTATILQNLNAEVHFSKNTITINPATINIFTAPKKLVSLMRASILVLGPLLAKYQTAKIALPGGCLIGARPIDIHLNCLAQLGVEFTEENNYISARVNGRLKGTTIEMQKASVGATENVIMAATLAEGITRIINPAKEPEIIDLVKMLNKMGAKITGEGTDLIIIEGVSSLTGTSYSVCPDRIEAGSYAIAAAMTNGDLILENIDTNSLINLINPLKLAGAEVTIISDKSIRVKGCDRLNPHTIKTGPYPDFPTDLQPQWATLMALAGGVSQIEETIFENRLLYTQELNKMGANIKIANQHLAIVNGVSSLHGAVVTPNDLRASFALVLAGLAANGVTCINKLEYLDRGYEDIVGKLNSCGANITRIEHSSPVELVSNTKSITILNN